METKPPAAHAATKAAFAMLRIATTMSAPSTHNAEVLTLFLVHIAVLTLSLVTGSFRNKGMASSKRVSDWLAIRRIKAYTKNIIGCGISPGVDG